MKITSIQTVNFLGARDISVTLTKPVALFAGRNGAGKSSLQEAVRMALTGEAVRVDLKKDYGRLITEGQEAGFAAVETDRAGYSIVLNTGKGDHADLPALPYVLDAQAFARLDDKARRAFLFGLMGIKAGGDDIRRRLVARLFNDEVPSTAEDVARIDKIMPFLKGGFDVAQTEAAGKARDAKARWKTVTGGETWGKDKAAKWAPAPLPADAEKAGNLYENARAQVAEIDKQLGTAQQDLGAAKSAAQRRQQMVSQRNELTETAERLPRIKEKLERDEKELAEWEVKVAETRERAGVAPVDVKAPGQFLLRGLASVTADFLELTCNHPEVQWPSDLINRAATHLGEYRSQHGEPVEAQDPGTPDPEAVENLPRYEKALTLLRSAVANGQRDLAAAVAASEKLKNLDQEQADGVDIEAAQAKVRDLTEKRDAWRADAEKYKAMADQSARRQAVIKEAAAAHADVLAWSAIADALAPDGIPGEILAEALDPINERLRSNAGLAEWEPVTIHADMAITYGQRDYALISESEKWRADAMIAEAVSHLAGVKLLVLDRFDVLDLNGREDLLYWLDGMAEDGDIDTALIFGTLKALPAKLLPNIEGHWIENGTAGQLQEAA